MIAEVEFEHALLNEPSKLVGGTPTPSKVVLDATKVFSVMYAPQHKATVILSIGGGHVPVTASIDEVTQKLKEAEEKIFGKPNPNPA